MSRRACWAARRPTAWRIRTTDGLPAPDRANKVPKSVSALGRRRRATPITCHRKETMGRRAKLANGDRQPGAGPVDRRTNSPCCDQVSVPLVGTVELSVVGVDRCFAQTAALVWAAGVGTKVITKRLAVSTAAVSCHGVLHVTYT
jgi:hypothetical protein